MDGRTEIHRLSDLRDRLGRVSRVSGLFSLDLASFAMNVYKNEALGEADIVAFNLPFPPLRLMKRDWVGLRILHHLQPLDNFRRLLTTPFDLTYERLTKPDLYVAHSTFSAQSYKAYLGKGRAEIRVVPEGVDGTRFSPAADGARIRKAFPSSKLILYVGPLEPSKQIDMLIRVFKRVKRKVPASQLVIVGEGSEKKKLQAVAGDLGLGSSVHFQGFVAEAELPAFYAASDVFATTSKLEGFGLVLLEAMASGLPTVAFAVASVPEVVSDCGVLIRPFDETEFADNVIRLLEDDAMHEDLARRGLERAKLFTWKNTARAIAENAGLLP